MKRMLLFLIFVSVLYTGCIGDVMTVEPGIIFNSPVFKKSLTPIPEPDKQLVELKLIEYRPYKNAAPVELGYVQKIKMIIPLKKWDDEGKNIEGAHSKVKVRADGSFKFSKRDKNGKITVYEAIEKYIWDITNLKGAPMGYIDDFGIIYKWMSSRGKMVRIGSGDIRSAVMKLFDLKWDIHLIKRSDGTPALWGDDPAEQPVVVLRKLDVHQLSKRFAENAKPLQEKAKKIRQGMVFKDGKWFEYRNGKWEQVKDDKNKDEQNND